MSLKIKYFGKIVEVTGVSNEQIDSIEKMDLKGLRELLNQRYPNLKSESFQIAVDHELRGDEFIIDLECEVAILPPFAGG
ncbi:MAG: molybdopterin converting factor small subunit [Crocinitomix sp.]|jgi:molybdopterin converting factor small subunit